ncbi:hypothetical protein O3Q51_05990 [Cryomorphaceae bacterium 1068]|nr:hypothetical protein [Cryomorphaceae bacterium 1068]
MGTKFEDKQISSEDGFWTMFYFLKEHYDLSGGAFELSDILSACEPVKRLNPALVIPADSSMVHYWNEALDKYRKNGKPDFK